MSEATAGAVRAWECTPTEETASAAATGKSGPNEKRFIGIKFVRGWQRTALFVILLVLMILVFLNLSLTLWIIATLKLTTQGIGPLKIVKGGISLEGHALVTDRLIASTISSRPAQPITLQAHRNFSILVSDPDQAEQSKLVIKRDGIQCGGRSFEVVDARGSSIFHASRDEVRVYSDVLSAEATGGLSVRSALQTPIVRAPHGSDLQLESQTRRLDLRAPQSIFMESRAGGIDITSHGNIKLDSAVGALKIDAPNIYISKLKEATAKPIGSPRNKHVKSHKVYQMCACASGKLFLAAPDALCAAHGDDIDLCR